MLAYLCLAISIEDVDDRGKAALATNAMVTGRVLLCWTSGISSAVPHVLIC